MPARKKPKAPQPPVPPPPDLSLTAPPSFGNSHRGLEEEITEYPEIQRNEFLTTRAIYPDEFERIRGRKDAWKTQENLAFQIRLGLLEDREYYVKLIFEFPRDYPKVLPRIDVIDIHPKDPKVHDRVHQIVATVPKQHQGSESVYEVNTAIMDFLDQVSTDKAAKQTDYSLEEERAAREASARKQLEEREQDARRQRAQDADAQDKLLQSQVEQRRQTNLSRKVTGDDPGDLYDEPEDPVRFDQPMVSRDIETAAPFKFRSVVGRAVILRRKDKKITIVAPRVDTSLVQAPQLLLKDIYLPETKATKGELEKVEEDLEASKEHHHDNVVDLINYKIEHLTLTGGGGQWRLAILSEFANRGSLRSLLDLCGALSAAKIRDWTRQLIDALDFFDMQGYTHPAVHAGNVMLFHASSGRITVKLADGYGARLRSLVDAVRDPATNRDRDSPLWVPPELNGPVPRRTNKTCIWELGVVVLEMVFGSGLKEMYTSPVNVLEGVDFNTSMENLMEQMCLSKPERRPSAFQLKHKEFFFEERVPIFRVQSPNFPSVPHRRRRHSNRQGNSIYRDEWEEHEKIGKGGFGKVFRAMRKLDGQYYAVKKISSKSKLELEEILREVSLLAKLNHPNVVRYYNAWREVEHDDDDDPDDVTDLRLPPQASKPPAALRSGHDFMSVSAYPNQGPEFSDSEDDRFGYQSPPPPADGTDYDDRVFETDPEPAPQLVDDASDPFAQPRFSSRLTPEQEQSNPFGSTDSPVPLRHTILPIRPSTPPEQKSTLYIQMELCEGQNLRHRINHGLPKDVDAVWRLFRLIVDGLAHIHSHGVVHRDLKPENIFLDAHDVPKIGDFGLATSGQATARSQVTAPGMEIGNSMGIGTYLYTAPELDKKGSRYDSRADMFSLGIMFFEMCYALSSVMERNDLIQRLRKHGVLPITFGDDRHTKQAEIILQLVSDQARRPTAQDLLDSGMIPEPLEDEKLQRYIDRMAQESPEEYHALITKLFGNPNSAVANLAWEDKSAREPSVTDSMLWISVTEQLKGIFRRHGAVENKRQGIIPKADCYANAATFLDPSGLVVQLPVDLTLPFARTLGQTNTCYSKTYCFGSVFRATGPGNEPRQVPEIDFDFVSHSAIDVALKEAEVIKVLDEILCEFPALASRKWTIYLNHCDLIDLILRFCRIKPVESSKVKQALSHLNTGATTWTQVREQLRSSAINIAETSVTDLSRFHFEGDLAKVRTRLSKLLGDSDYFNEALPLLGRLGELMDLLGRMKVKTDVLVAPLSNNSEHLYRRSLLFQCTETTHRKVLAVGGRYDELVKGYQTRSDKYSTRAVGFRLNVSDVVGYLRKEAQLHTGSRKAAPADFKLTRCDILVTSFDVNVLRQSCVEVLSFLWAAGLSAELSEEFHSLEELELAHKDNGGYWLVIVRGGAGERSLKVRSPSRVEDEVKAAELVSFLRLNMAKNR